MAADKIDIVIPIYRNLDLTRKCVESVLRAADPVMGSLVLINDASPDPEVANYCREIASSESISLITHDENRGFVCSVNEGFGFSKDRDVVILNSDTEVPSKWLSRLKALADSQPRAASLTPFSNNATICSYPHFCQENLLPNGLDCAAMDALFASANEGQAIEIPTSVGFCMYLRREALHEVGLFDEEAFGRGYGEENDWCLRATAKGWKHLLCADLFVSHAGGASFGDEASQHQARALSVISQRYPDYERDIAAFVEADPIEIARYNVDKVRPDTTAVITEYRSRERRALSERYTLDRQRHEQVTELDALLQQTRQSASEEAERYEVLLSEQRAETATAELKYQQQITGMAEELQGLRRFWPVRVRNWLLRKLGRQ
jgi:GT2 family glycosyltransferase